MSPVQHDPELEQQPDPGEVDFTAAVGSFVDAALAGRVSQSETVQAWARHLEGILERQPARPDPKRWN
jgi:hypothetical protein